MPSQGFGGGIPRYQFLRPNVRAKRATTAWRAGQQAQNGPQAQRLIGQRDMPLALRLSEGLGLSWEDCCFEWIEEPNILDEVIFHLVDDD